MRKFLLALAVVMTVLIAGCSGTVSGGAPKATSPETTFDFGDVPVTADMLHHSFTIQNTGNADLKLSDVQVKLLQGC
ncbi:MAG TPA: hypothetical protein VGK74_19270 [Symbiobacteriaceae bacterium]